MRAVRLLPRPRRRGAAGLLAVVLALALTACGSDPDEQTAPRDDPPTEVEQPDPPPEVDDPPVESDPGAEVDDPPPIDEPAVEPPDPDGVPELVWVHQHEHPINAVAVSPDNATVAVAEWATYLHQLADGLLIDAVVSPTRPEDLAYTADGTRLAIGMSLGGVLVVDPADVEVVAELQGSFDNRVAAAPDAALLALGDRDGAVTLWDLDDEVAVGTLPAGPEDWVQALDFHPAGQLLAVTHSDCRVLIWDLDTQALVGEVELDTGEGSCLLSRAFAFAPDGTSALGPVREDGAPLLRVWDPGSLDVIGEFEAPDRPRDLAFSPDGSRLAVAANAVTALLELPGGDLRHTFGEAATIGLVPTPQVTAMDQEGGHVVFGWSDGTVELWRLPGAEELVAPEPEPCEPLPLPGDVLFDTGSADLRAEADEALEALVTDLATRFEQATLTFVGHTDSRGAPADNLALSEQRAEQVAAWVATWAQDTGLAWELRTEGAGDTALKVPDVGEDGAFLEGAGAINRRVEILIDAPGCT